MMLFLLLNIIQTAYVSKGTEEATGYGADGHLFKSQTTMPETEKLSYVSQAINAYLFRISEAISVERRGKDSVFNILCHDASGLGKPFERMTAV